MLKRLMDLLVALSLLLVLSPVLILVMLALKISGGGPVLFRQVRPGLHGKPFEFYKLRTMTDARNSYGKPLPDEMRLTSVGKILRKLSLDELPQLINVIKGDMSLVGPRPLLMEYLSLYTTEQARRHDVKPGITGWAQVNGRNALTWKDKFHLDVWYVNHQSFWLDLKILWLTLWRVIEAKDINRPGAATMTKFTGNPDE